MSRIARCGAVLIVAVSLISTACGDSQAADPGPDVVKAVVLTRPVSHLDRIPPDYDLVGSVSATVEWSKDDALAHELEPAAPPSPRPRREVIDLPVQ